MHALGMGALSSLADPAVPANCRPVSHCGEWRARRVALSIEDSLRQVRQRHTNCNWLDRLNCENCVKVNCETVTLWHCATIDCDIDDSEYATPVLNRFESLIGW